MGSTQSTWGQLVGLERKSTTSKMKIQLLLLSILVAINMCSGKKYLVETKDGMNSDYSNNDYNLDSPAVSKGQGQDYFLGLGLGRMFQQLVPQIQNMLQNQANQG